MGPQSPQAAKPLSASGPVMDVVARPPAEQLAAAPADTEAVPQTKKDTRKAEVRNTPKVPKSRNGNVTLAIVATVIIVLGMGALTVFAYLKQTGSI